MKNVFIINPKAGQGKNTQKLISEIEQHKNSYDIEIYITKAAKDATQYVRDYCKQHGPARFIACGGDGTFSEVLNGAIETEGSEIGVMPFGTGNDFCKNFDASKNFRSVLSQIMGKAEKCDVIKYTNSDKTYGYCTNMFNIGFDCNVADMASKMKKKLFISGSLAYLLSIFVILMKKKGANLKIEVNKKIIYNDYLLLTSVANGQYCGGGIKANPNANVKNGMINVNVIKNISRIKFLCALPLYIKGNHIKHDWIKKLIMNFDCKKLKITPNQGELKLCADGEIFHATETEFEILENAFSFVIPV